MAGEIDVNFNELRRLDAESDQISHGRLQPEPRLLQEGPIGIRQNVVGEDAAQVVRGVPEVLEVIKNEPVEAFRRTAPSPGEMRS